MGTDRSCGVVEKRQYKHFGTCNEKQKKNVEKKDSKSFLFPVRVQMERMYTLSNISYD